MTDQKNPMMLMKTEEVKNKFNEVLGKRGSAFITTVLQVISQSDMLKEADPKTVFSAAMVAATLDLPVNPNLGFAYIVPYKGKDGITRAQFQIGYKGFIQLALRSGRFKTISTTAVYKGQLTGMNPLTGYVFDRNIMPEGEPIGYAAYFELLDGFEKVMYMTIDELKKHGAKFSQSYKKGFGLRKDDFHNMAQKTVLKLLLSKYAPLSSEMQKAVETDQAVMSMTDSEEVIEYPDNDTDAIIDQDLEETLEGAKAVTE